MRKTFAEELFNRARGNKDIVLLTGDLGYGMWNRFRDELPDQFYNVGASEQSMMGIAVGMTLKGKIPFVYSITSFLLYRPFETIRNYIDHESIPVHLVGSGRDKDYEHDGFSHWSEEALTVLKNFKNLTQFWPNKKEEIPNMIDKIIKSNKPTFISLKRT